MALISQFYGHTALDAAARTFSATFVSMTTLVEPVIAGAFAAWILDECLAPATLAGSLVILAGIGLALRDERLPRVTRTRSPLRSASDR